MKEVYWEIKINNLSGPRQAKFWQKSGPRFVYFDLPIYFLHDSGHVSFGCWNPLLCLNSLSVLFARSVLSPWNHWQDLRYTRRKSIGMKNYTIVMIVASQRIQRKCWGMWESYLTIYVRVVCNIAGTDDQLRHNTKVVVVRHPPPPQQQLFRLNSMGSLSLNLDY